MCPVTVITPLFQVRGHGQEVIPEAKGQIPAYCILTVPHCQNPLSTPTNSYFIEVNYISGTRSLVIITIDCNFCIYSGSHKIPGSFRDGELTDNLPHTTNTRNWDLYTKNRHSYNDRTFQSMCVAVKSLYSHPILVSVKDVNKVIMVQMLVMRAILQCPKNVDF